MAVSALMAYPVVMPWAALAGMASWDSEGMV